MAEIIALIPARSGSKGVPGKNIRELGGHTLLEWSIAACKKSKLIDKVIVSTDSCEYADLAIELGAEAPFLRPIEISSDRSTDFEFISHAISWLESNLIFSRYIVHVRPTTPFRDPKLIDSAISSFIRSPSYTALRSVHEMSESAYKTFEITKDGRLKPVGSMSSNLDPSNEMRQAFPLTYIANGYVDVLSVEFIKKFNLIHGDNVMPFVTPVVGEIDTEYDFMQLLDYAVKHPDVFKPIFEEN